MSRLTTTPTLRPDSEPFLFTNMYEYIHHLWVSHPPSLPSSPLHDNAPCSSQILSIIYRQITLPGDCLRGQHNSHLLFLTSLGWVQGQQASRYVLSDLHEKYIKVHSKYIYLTWQEIVLTNLCILTDCTLFFNSWHITDQLIWWWRSSKSWFIFIFCEIDTKRNLINSYCQHLIDQMPRLQSPIDQLSLKESERLYKR